VTRHPVQEQRHDHAEPQTQLQQGADRQDRRRLRGAGEADRSQVSAKGEGRQADACMGSI